MALPSLEAKLRQTKPDQTVGFARQLGRNDMGLIVDLNDTIDAVTGVAYEVRTGRKVPDTDDVLYNQGVLLSATYLYADMVDCSGLIAQCGKDDMETAGKVIRLFLDVAVRIIKDHDGQIRSFDGDRVMGIFLDEGRQDRAVRSAMKIKWACSELIQPALDESYDTIRDGTWKLRPGCGVAGGQSSLLVRGGVRHQDNDLVAIGQAPNLGAKLSDQREGRHNVIISKGTYDNLSTSLLTGNNGKHMWTKGSGVVMGGVSYPFWKTSYHIKIT